MVAVLAVFVLILNIGGLRGFTWLVPEPVSHIATVLRLSQRWDMFAPQPLIYDGWYVIAGKLTDGRQVDVFRNEEVAPNFEKPRRIYAMYPDQKWRKYMVNLTVESFAPLRMWYAGWLCRRWNDDSEHTEKLEEFIIYFMVEPTPPPGEEFHIFERPMWHHRCLD